MTIQDDNRVLMMKYRLAVKNVLRLILDFIKMCLTFDDLWSLIWYFFLCKKKTFPLIDCARRLGSFFCFSCWLFAGIFHFLQTKQEKLRWNENWCFLALNSIHHLLNCKSNDIKKGVDVIMSCYLPINYKFNDKY